jgi:hypothetical protein
MKYLNKEICAGIVLSLGFTGMGATIYNDAGNTAVGNMFSLSSGVTYGNEITVASGWTLTQFSFEYYSVNNSTVDVAFYANTGTANANGFATPALSAFYNSGAVSAAAGLNDLTFSQADFGSSLTLPTDFTFTVTFSNFGTSGSVSLPVVAATKNVSYGDYWLNNNAGGGWQLLTNSAAPGSFVVDFEGTSSVPEPSVYALGAIGSLLLLGANKLKRKI